MAVLEEKQVGDDSRHVMQTVFKAEEGFFFSSSKLPIFICLTICVDA